MKSILDLIQEQINKMKQRMAKEKEINDQLLPTLRGNEVTYGTEIQLMHYNSQSFLNGKIQCSEFDQSAYCLELSNNFSSGMIFKILPRFQIKQEGEKIQLNDQIYLHNVKLDCFVNFCVNRSVFIDAYLDKSILPSPYH